MKKKLFIFSNESISIEDNKFYCDNLDLKSTPEGLNKKFEVNLLGRRSIKKRSHEIKIKRIKVFSNIFSYLSEVKRASKNLDTKFLIISITPYTFLISIFLKILGQKPIVYLRSDGYGEYKAILGRIGSLVYHFMFSITGAISNLISCRDYILHGKKGKLINPSQLDSVWLRQPKNIEIRNFKLLYVGRLRVEKGIFSLIEIIKKLKFNFEFTIVNPEKLNSNKLKNEKIKIVQFNKNHDSLINIYDNSNIFYIYFMCSATFF